MVDTAAMVSRNDCVHKSTKHLDEKGWRQDSPPKEVEYNENGVTSLS